MYTFIDTTEVSEGVTLPSEALQINGEYIENLIDGYRTLNVQGRESLSPEVSIYETGIRDGAQLQNRRFPARTIVVTYQLACASNEAFREAFNALGGILNVEDARLIFNDEQDKFFIGTPAGLDEVEPGRNYIVSSFEILCTDPFKYSVVEYEAEPWADDGTLLIDYGGTYKAYPTLEADFYSEEDTAGLTGNGDCGFVAFFNEDEKIIQLGDPEEVDSETAYEKSQTLTNQTFLSDTAWGTTAQSLWTVNDGIVPADVTQVGDVAMQVASYATPSSPAATSGTLLSKKKSDVGSPYIYYTVTAKASKRTANSVYVTATITSALWTSQSWFGNGYGLKGSLYIGGAWHDVTLKKTSEYWKGATGHTVNLSFTVSGLTESQTALTGMQFKVTRTDSYGTTGTLNAVSCNNLAISAYETDTAEKYYLAAADYGSGTGYHGPSITRTLTADASGEVGATDFTFTYSQKMCIGNGTNAANQLGGFHAHLSADDGTVIAGVRIVKTAAGKSASLMLYVNGEKVHQVGIDLSYYNQYFGASSKSVQTSKITKTGNKVVFNIGGYSQTFINDAISDIMVTKITFMFEKYASSTALEYNGLFTAKFIKNNCDTYRDIPNKFSTNDVVKADCKNGEIYLNGILSPELGALGNDWEDFYLTPGLNQIGIAYSDWVEADYAPAFKVRYREVFL